MVQVNKFLGYGLKGAAALIVLGLIIMAASVLVARSLEAVWADSTTGFRFGIFALLGFVSLGIQVSIVAAVGYLVVKNKGGDIVEGGLGGAIAYALSYVVGAVIGVVIGALGFGLSPTMGGSTIVSSLMSVLCLPVYGAVAFVIGAIGAYGASYMLKRGNAQKKK